MPATLLTAMLAQQLPRTWIQHPHYMAVPLHFHATADPAWRRTVVGGIDFDTAIQVHAPVAKLIHTEWLQRQWQQRRLLFGEHGGYLALGGAMDARVGPLSFPVIEIGLGLLQALKAQAFQGCVLGVPDAALDFPLPIRIGDAARQRDGAIVGEHVAIQRI